MPKQRKPAPGPMSSKKGQQMIDFVHFLIQKLSGSDRRCTGLFLLLLLFRAGSPTTTTCTVIVVRIISGGWHQQFGQHWNKALALRTVQLEHIGRRR